MWLVEKGTLVAGVITYPHRPESLLRSGDEIRQSIFSVGLDFHPIPSIFSSPGMTTVAINTIPDTALEPPALSLGSFDLHGVDGLAPLIRDDDLPAPLPRQAGLLGQYFDLFARAQAGGDDFQSFHVLCEDFLKPLSGRRA